MTPVTTPYPDRASWLKARRRGIGGSDVPAILGISPWGTPLKVWTEKVGLAAETEDSYTLRRGSHMEGLLAGELERAIELTVADDSVIASVDWEPGLRRIAQHGEFPWLLYSPDTFVSVRDVKTRAETRALGEFKSHPRGASEWTHDVPAHVRAQVQHGLDVCDLRTAYVGVDLGTEFRWARIDRDDAWIAETRPKLAEFWLLVEHETPPVPTGDEGDKAALAAMYPREAGEKVIALPDDLLEAAQRLDELAASRRAIEAEESAIQNRARAALADAGRGVLPDGSGWTWQTQSRVVMVKDPGGAIAESRALRRFQARKER